MKVKFFNVKKRTEANIEETECRKVVYERSTSKGIQLRYAVRAKDNDGSNLTKFVNKETFDNLKCPLAKE